MGSFAKQAILTHAPHLPATTTAPASTRTSLRPAAVSAASFLVSAMLEVRPPQLPAESESGGTRSFSPEEAVAGRIRQTTEGMHGMHHSDVKNAMTRLPKNRRRAYSNIADEVYNRWDRFSAGSQHTTTMQAVMSVSTRRTHLNKINHNSVGRSTMWNASWSWSKEEKRNGRTTTWKVNALPDWPLMAVMVEHVAGSRDWVVTKSVWHLNDEEIKNVYTMYIMFTCWGCCFFASMKDPFYDGEAYRKDGGDGSVHWLYDKQEEIEEQARAELWREELIEEIEKKVGGLRELEEAKEEELVK